MPLSFSAPPTLKPLPKPQPTRAGEAHETLNLKKRYTFPPVPFRRSNKKVNGNPAIIQTRKERGVHALPLRFSGEQREGEGVFAQPSEITERSDRKTVTGVSEFVGQPTSSDFTVARESNSCCSSFRIGFVCIVRCGASNPTEIAASAWGSINLREAISNGVDACSSLEEALLAAAPMLSCARVAGGDCSGAVTAVVPASCYHYRI